MSRLLALWLTLLAAFWLTRAVASAVLFGNPDRGYESVIQLVTVPAFQALLVAWATRRPGPFAHAVPVRAALRQPDLRTILLLDAAVLVSGWVLGTFGGIGWFGLAQGRNLPSIWVALKAGAAGVVLGLDTRGSSPERGEDRRWLLGLAAGLIALALMVLFDVLRALPALLFPTRPPLLRWLLVHGVLTIAGTALLLRVQRIFRHDRDRRPAAALALDWTLGFGLVAALTSALHLFHRPFLMEPWGSLVATCNSLAVTALLAAALLARGRTVHTPESFAGEEG
ncbi:MAG TPA: hypothetical protein VN493_08650 [Thermoanaerobaculia bacterium]|nr:hypothetical protein [Thermoanaerobaculia bacterium]